MKHNIRKLGMRGMSHIIIPLGIIVVVGVAATGYYVLNHGHALASYSIQSSAATTDFNLVNHERTTRGIKALVRTTALNSCALAWAEHVAAYDVLSDPPLPGKCSLSTYHYVGANAGWGGSAAAIHTAYMNSASHKANILDKGYTQIGTATVYGSSRYWNIEVFKQP